MQSSDSGVADCVSSTDPKNKSKQFDTTKTLTYSYTPRGRATRPNHVHGGPTSTHKRLAELVKTTAASGGHGVAGYMVAAEYEAFDTSNAHPLADLLLDKAAVLLQDDTGLPFGQLVHHFPDIDMYGDYAGPAVLPFAPQSIISSIVQPGLIAFSGVTRLTRRAGPLPAPAVGYTHWLLNHVSGTTAQIGQCLLVVQRSIGAARPTIGATTPR